jgi:hypothetical protein
MHRRNTRTEVILLRNCAGLRLKDIGFLLNEYAAFWLPPVSMTEPAGGFYLSDIIHAFAVIVNFPLSGAALDKPTGNVYTEIQYRSRGD